MTRYDQFKQRREERIRREKLAAEAQRRKEEQERIAERDRKLQQQTDYLKMRLEETGKLHNDDPEH
ncbi:MAG TPA: hypothetical protein VGN29_17875 [Solirubrobacteraceae bacterium]|nr:hypothetical protein [Solirubrobacteraceae bacterium]